MQKKKKNAIKEKMKRNKKNGEEERRKKPVGREEIRSQGARVSSQPQIETRFSSKLHVGPSDRELSSDTLELHLMTRFDPCDGVKLGEQLRDSGD